MIDGVKNCNTILANPWPTPFQGVEYLFFEGLLNISNVVVFLSDNQNNTYTVAFNSKSSYRVVDETYLDHLHTVLVAARKDLESCSTYQFWNTLFSREIFDESSTENQRLNSYVILTDSECLEFFADNPEVKMFQKRRSREVIEEFFRVGILNRVCQKPDPLNPINTIVNRNSPHGINAYPKMFGKLWDTPLNGVEALLFEGLINLTNITIFFSDAKNNVYTITLNTGNPYRVVDQVNLPHFVDLRDTFAQSNTEPRTFKMWNSPFKTEINTSTLLFMDVEEEDQFSFGIFAANACIEFIASPPEITVHTNITASKVIEAFFEESIQLMTLDQN